ncbi:MAG: hypothetical protein Q4A90_03245 [Streptococcus sp.]|nr:hypothetical protein [Streptococcus sp.]
MTYVLETIPEEYFDMIKQFGLYKSGTKMEDWVADKEKGIFLWVYRCFTRDDPTNDFVLIWKNQVVKLNVQLYDILEDPVWDEENEVYLKKGLVIRRIHWMTIPKELVGQEKELLEIINETFQYYSRQYNTRFSYIAPASVRED